jgi:hypothetical protein
MAEREISPTQRQLSVTIGDGTHSYVFRVPQSGIRWAKEKFDPIWAQDSDGSYLNTPAAGPRTAPAELEITGPMRLQDPGVNTTEAVAIDLVEVAGYVSSTWTTTDTDSEYRAFTVTVALAKIGTSPGASWAWTDAVIVNQPDYTITPEGFFLSAIMFQAPSNPTHTRVT